VTATFEYTEALPLGPDNHTEYRLVTPDGVDLIEAGGRTFLSVDPSALTALAKEAIRDIQHLLRPSHLAQLRAIVDDPEASGNDRFVAMDLLRNACISAGGVLPMCQDTGTAIVIGKRTENVLTGGADEAALSRGIFEAYQELNLRYSQLAPVSFWDERNTGTNLPAQIELYHKDGAKPSTSSCSWPRAAAARTRPSLPGNEGAAEPQAARELPRREAAQPRHSRLPALPTWRSSWAAPPPSTTSRSPSSPPPATSTTSRSKAAPPGTRSATVDLGSRSSRMTRQFGIGAQFGGKYFCHDVRVIRLPRHGASCPVGLAVSCSADRQAKAKITADGV